MAVLVIIHNRVIVVNLRGNVIRHIDRERDWNLWEQFLIDVAIRHPDHLAICVVIGSQNMRNVHDLAALID